MPKGRGFPPAFLPKNTGRYDMALKKIVLCIDKINNLITSCTTWLIIPLIGIMLFEVVMRYAFHSPTVWGAELSLMIFGCYMIYSGPTSVYNKVQVGVDLFSSKWSPRTQAVVYCLTYAFTTIFFYCIIKMAFKYGLESWEMKELSTSAWSQPIYHLKMMIPIALTLTYLQTFAEFLRNLYKAVTGKDL